MRDVFLTGDSHTAALRRGQTAIEADGGWPQDLRLTIQPLGGGHLTREPFFIDRGDHAEITAVEYRRRFDRLPLEHAAGADTVYGFSAPLHSARIWRHPDWQNYAPAAMALPGTPVSSGMVSRLVLADQKYVLDLLALMTRIGRRVFVIEAPYPFHHHPALRKSPAAVVRHLDRAYRAIVRSELARLEVPVVAVPQDCTEDGFMRSEYGQPGDHHHGNERYGRTMMSEILAFLDRDWSAAPDVALPPTGLRLPAEEMRA